MLNSTHARYMPALNTHFAEAGLQLRNFLISTAACCPSRSILMTGRYTHNNNVTSNIEPHGASGGEGLGGGPGRCRSRGFTGQSPKRTQGGFGG